MTHSVIFNCSEQEAVKHLIDEARENPAIISIVLYISSGFNIEASKFFVSDAATDYCPTIVYNKILGVILCNEKEPVYATDRYTVANFIKRHKCNYVYYP